VTVIQTSLALLLALAANKKIRGQGTFRTIFYLPSIMSSAAMTLIFVWLFQKQGVVNQAISWWLNNLDVIVVFLISGLVCQLLLVLKGRQTYRWISWFDPFYLVFSLIAALVFSIIFRSYQPISPDAIISADITWLATRETIGPLPRTMWAIVALNTFTTVPTLMLLYLAGLQSISESLYEAATLEGANAWQKLVYVTWPRLMPVSFMVVTLGLIGTLQMFDQVALLGNSAPMESKITLAYYTFYNAFPPGGTPRIGIASAGALMLAALTLSMVLFQRLLGLKEQGND
jgi:multiple sugar transport system permease protein